MSEKRHYPPLVQSATFHQKLRFLFRQLRDQKVLVITLLSLEVFISLLNAIIPYFLKLQVDVLQQNSLQYFQEFFTSQTWFVFLLLIPAGIELMRIALFDRLIDRTSMRFNAQLKETSERLIREKLRTFDIGFFQNHKNKRILFSAQSSTNIGSDFFGFLKSRVRNLVSILAIIPIFGFVSWPLLVCVMVAAVIQGFIENLRRSFSVATEALESKRTEAFWRVSSAIDQHFYALNMFGAIKPIVERYFELMRERDSIQAYQEDRIQRYRIANEIVGKGMLVIINIFVGFQVLQGNLSLGTFTLVVSYTLQLNSIFVQFFESAQEWQKIDFQFDQFQFFLQLKPRIKSVENPLSASASQKIEMKEVVFSYPSFFAEEKAYLKMMVNKAKDAISNHVWWWRSSQSDLSDLQELLEEDTEQLQVLDSVNVALTRGKIIALLGRNGAGKTTITQLLLHQYEPTKGRILLDDIELFKYDQSYLLSQFAIIQQEPVVLHGFSVKENVLFGVRKEVSDDEIWELFKKLSIKEVIERLPQMLDTIVGEQTNFSGGQNQLIAVARVFLQKRNFLIFDEGMSQMDIEKEAHVMSLIKEEANRAAVLFITHRITTARKADYIYFLDKGKIVEQGTHTELIKKEGMYAQFWKMQVIE